MKMCYNIRTYMMQNVDNSANTNIQGEYTCHLAL